MLKESFSCIQTFLQEKVNECRVLVVGDVMLDRYFYGQVARISPEAPVPVNLVKDKRDTLGGAANVAHNLARLGVHSYLAGVIGSDHHGRVLKKKMKQVGIDTYGLIEGRERTTTKIRILGGHQQMLRVDFEEAEPLNTSLAERMLDYVKERIMQGLDAVIISDYGKGVCTDQVCQLVIKQCQEENIPVFVDPKGHDWNRYRGADYVTPNVKEVNDVLGDNLANEEAPLQEAAGKIQSTFQIKNIVITRSEKGISVFTPGKNMHIPTVAQEVFDVSGAGDTVISGLAAGIGAGLPLDAATMMANFTAGIEVGKIGTYAVSGEEILDKLKCARG